MSNEKPLKLNMSFRQALEMIASGGKPPPEAKAISKDKPAKKRPAVKKSAKKP